MAKISREKKSHLGKCIMVDALKEKQISLLLQCMFTLIILKQTKIVLTYLMMILSCFIFNQFQRAFQVYFKLNICLQSKFPHVIKHLFNYLKKICSTQCKFEYRYTLQCFDYLCNLQQYNVITNCNTFMCIKLC